MSGARRIDEDLATIYLSDHAAGAMAMTRRLRRMADAYDGELAATMGALADVLAREREWILDLMEARGLTPSRWKSLASAVGEQVARLKPNGRAAGESTLSPLLELEILTAGLRGKRSGWRTIREWATELDADTDQLDALLADVERQIEQVEHLLTEQRPQALRRT